MPASLSNGFIGLLGGLGGATQGYANQLQTNIQNAAKSRQLDLEQGYQTQAGIKQAADLKEAGLIKNADGTVTPDPSQLVDDPSNPGQKLSYTAGLAQNKAVGSGFLPRTIQPNALGFSNIPKGVSMSDTVLPYLQKMREYGDFTSAMGGPSSQTPAPNEQNQGQGPTQSAQSGGMISGLMNPQASQSGLTVQDLLDKANTNPQFAGLAENNPYFKSVIDTGRKAQELNLAQAKLANEQQNQERQASQFQQGKAQEGAQFQQSQGAESNRFSTTAKKQAIEDAQNKFMADAKPYVEDQAGAQKALDMINSGKAVNFAELDASLSKSPRLAQLMMNNEPMAVKADRLATSASSLFNNNPKMSADSAAYYKNMLQNNLGSSQDTVNQLKAAHTANLQNLNQSAGLGLKPEEINAAISTPLSKGASSGKVMMTLPDGSKAMIPQANVNAAKRRGAILAQ